MREAIQSYGVSSRSFLDLGGVASSGLLDYLDLLQRDDGGQSDAEILLPDGVAESQGRPLLFIIHESRLGQAPDEQEQQLNTLRRKLACRGDRAYLARIRPGELAVVPVSLDDRTPAWRLYKRDTPEALTFFTRLFEEDNDGFRLPHPPLSLRVHLVVESAICAAWELMTKCGRAGFDLQTTSEDTVTHELYERLYDEVFDKGVVNGFDREVFASMRREPKVRNFNGSHPDKMPDLLVEFIDRPVGAMNSQHGLFIGSSLFSVE
ncbi:MAG: hypothetical protein IH623_03900 [Verrucomicrobia bacterium]|nr:hypothetical protein [Verrucomicrobiota bacterium]